MSSNKAVKPFVLFDDVDASVDQVSRVLPCQYQDIGNILLIWTGSPIGTFTVEVQNGDDGTWNELNFGEDLVVPTVAPDDTDRVKLEFTSISFSALRINYSAASGSGTIRGEANIKSVGV